MGIRFECPNGHKLHVKAFLAGKRGICPDCGAKFWIPAAHSVAEPQPVHAGVGGRNALLEPKRDPSAPEASDVIRLVGEVEKPPVKAASAEPPSSSDFPAPPILQPRLSLWYVRPTGGGQFGPATEEVFKRWIADGRVTEDAIVWRDGWPDWKPVHEVADLLPAPLPLVVSNAAIALPPGPHVASVPDPLAIAMVNEELEEISPSDDIDSTRAVYRSLNRRVRQRQLRRKYALLLLAATLVLGALFVIILMRNSAAEPPADPADAATPLAQ